MARFILIVLVVLFAIRAFGRLFGGIAQGARGPRPTAPGSGAAPVKMIKDPVCGMTVEVGTGAITAVDADGQARYFCSEGCRYAYRPLRNVS